MIVKISKSQNASTWNNKTTCLLVHDFVRLSLNETNDGRKCEKTLTIKKILTSSLTKLNFVGRAESWMPRLECIGWHSVVMNDLFDDV